MLLEDLIKKSDLPSGVLCHCSYRWSHHCHFHGIRWCYRPVNHLLPHLGHLGCHLVIQLGVEHGVECAVQREDGDGGHLVPSSTSIQQYKVGSRRTQNPTSLAIANAIYNLPDSRTTYDTMRTVTKGDKATRTPAKLGKEKRSTRMGQIMLEFFSTLTEISICKYLN